MNNYYIYFEFAKLYPFQTIIFILLSLIYPLDLVVIPHYIGKIIDCLNGASNQSYLRGYVLTTIALFIFVTIMFNFENYYKTSTYPLLQKFINNKIFKQVFLINKTNYNSSHNKNIMSNIIKLPDALYGFLKDLEDKIIPYGLSFIISIIFVFYYNKKIAIILGIIIISLAILTLLSLNNCADLEIEKEEKINDIYDETDDLLSNLDSIMNMNTYDKELNYFDKQYDDYNNILSKSLNCNLKFKTIFIIIEFICVGIIIYILVKQTSKKIDLGHLVSLILILSGTFSAINVISYEIDNLVINNTAINQGMKIFNNISNYNTLSNKIKNIPKTGIYLHNISLTFENGKKLLQNLNLHIPINQKLAIIGKIGCGKSTIIKLIMNYILPTSGEIFINGISYSKLTPEQIRQQIGVLIQNPKLFNRTLYENISYGTNYTKTEVYNIINKLNLSEIINKFDKGLDTIVGKQGSLMSGGERQIVWLIRLVLQNPSIIILDEPTASLDENTKKIVISILSKITKNKTVIMVTHDKSLLKYSNKTIEIKNGKIITIT